MKFYQWICGAFLLGAIASCSNDDISGPDTPKEGEKTTGYLSLKINLPQEGISRANADNVEFDDGEGWEYAVNDAKLLLFTASTNKVADAKFYKSYTLNRPFSPSDPANDQVTSSSVEAVAVNFTNNNDHIWALVMLNVPTIGVSDPSEGQLFSEYRTKNDVNSPVEFMKTVNGKKYIFMTNAPLSAEQGGAAKPESPVISTLAYLGQVKDKVKSTLQEARQNVAGCIYVERALAKVTATIKNPTVTILGDPDADGKATDLGLSVDKDASSFGLDHINKFSYIIRNVIDWPTLTNEDDFAWDMTSPSLGTPYYRMIGNIQMPGYAENPVLHNTEQSKYRTYWCVDPNYNTKLGSDYTTSTDAEYLPIDGENAFYPKENTFTVENQNYGNSTLAVFKITFVKDGDVKDLFIINKNYEVVYTDVKAATSNMYQYILSQDKVKEALKVSVKTGVTETEKIDFTPFLGLDFERNAQGIYVVTNIKLDNTAAKYSDYYDSNSPAKFNESLTKAVEDDLISRVNALYEISMYEGGVSYYGIPIQHFGQLSTPWAATAGQDQSLTDQAYPTNPKTKKYDSPRYLGRYGVVRNNWYEIDVTSFKGLGYPVKPDFKDVLDLSDDNNPVKKYIGVETHILSWAKRTQSVGF